MTIKPEDDPADETNKGADPFGPDDLVAPPPPPLPPSLQDPTPEPELVAPPAPAPPPARGEADNLPALRLGTDLVAPDPEPARHPAPYGASTSTELGPVLPARRSRKPLVLAVLAALSITGGVLAATGTFKGDPASSADSNPFADAAVASSSSGGSKQGAADTEDGMPPLPKSRPKLVQPVAGETSETPVKAVKAQSGGKQSTGRPQITGPASEGSNGSVRDPGVRNLQADKATALPNGVALPPLEAPEAVLDVIRAGNIIARTPYKWGGGHGRFQDNGYDCSGSVSYALYYAGLLDGPHTSGELQAYGKPGPGKWITIYANAGHVYMTVAGIGFDTSAANPGNHFSRWRNDLRGNQGFEVRHPAGL